MKEYKKKSPYFFLLLFVLSCLFLRIKIPLIQGADFLYYLKGRDFIISLNKPFEDIMVSIFFNITNFFVQDKLISITILYWTVFLTITVFYVWLVFSKIEMFKKTLLFSITYFLFAFTLLRNAPSYELVFLFFYFFIYKKKKFYLLLFAAVSFHFSSLVVLLSQVNYKSFRKHIFIFIILLIGLPFLYLLGYIDLDVFTKKIKAYHSMQYNFNRNHLFWLIFIIILFAAALKENYKTTLKTSLTLFFIVFIITYIVNPIPAFRMSIYFIIIYSIIPSANPKIIAYLKTINKSSFLFFILFLLSFIKTLQKDFELFGLNF